MSKTSSSSGIGFVGMLTILFIGLKLAGVINWDWLWVLSPIWITAIITIAIILLAVTYGIKREEEEQRAKPPNSTPTRKSRFEEKLDEAMKASAERKNQN
jgi:hypothetical protein